MDEEDDRSSLARNPGNYANYLILGSQQLTWEGPEIAVSGLWAKCNNAQIPHKHSKKKKINLPPNPSERAARTICCSFDRAWSATLLIVSRFSQPAIAERVTNLPQACRWENIKIVKLIAVNIRNYWEQTKLKIIFIRTCEGTANLSTYWTWGKKDKKEENIIWQMSKKTRQHFHQNSSYLDQSSKFGQNDQKCFIFFDKMIKFTDIVSLNRRRSVQNSIL